MNKSWAADQQYKLDDFYKLENFAPLAFFFYLWNLDDLNISIRSTQVYAKLVLMLGFLSFISLLVRSFRGLGALYLLLLLFFAVLSAMLYCYLNRSH